MWSLVGALLFATALLVSYVLTSDLPYGTPTTVIGTRNTQEAVKKGSSALITVTVNPHRGNGHAWDELANAPDIAICILTSTRTYCDPDAVNPASISKARCRDSFKCGFHAIHIPKGYFTVVVIDVDTPINEIIGTAQCRAGMTCQAGEALVAIAKHAGAPNAEAAPAQLVQETTAPPTRGPEEQLNPPTREPEEQLDPSAEEVSAVVPPEPKEKDHDRLFRLLNAKTRVDSSSGQSSRTNAALFMEKVSKSDSGRHILNAEVYQVGKAMHSDVLVVTVGDGWHPQSKGTRLKQAKRLWKGWARINSPSDLNRSYLWIDSSNGKRVGGSRVMSGSLVWVK
jgi:hypothetical protein